MPSPLPQQKCGTRCRRRSRHCRHWRLSSAHWRRNCSVDHTATHTTGNSSIDTSVTRDTQRPWSFVRLASRRNSLMMMMMMNKLNSNDRRYISAQTSSDFFVHSNWQKSMIKSYQLTHHNEMLGRKVTLFNTAIFFSCNKKSEKGRSIHWTHWRRNEVFR